MADSKITDLASGSPVAATDSFIIARSGANYKVTQADLMGIPTPVGQSTSTALLGCSLYVVNRMGLYMQTDTMALVDSGGTSRFAANASGSIIGSGTQYLWSSTSAALSGSNDTGLAREAAGVVGVTNGSSGNGQLCLEGVSGHRIASAIVTLTEAGGAEVVAVVTTATTEMTGGELLYTIRATDATDRAVRTGSFRFAMQNAAGTVTANIATATNETNDGSAIISTNAKTLTYAIAADVGTANKCKFTFNIDSDMVVSAASITWTMTLNGPGTVSTS